ncbi:MAG: hypothetical protein LDL33_01070 [Desulfomonile sp.]|nr:hypothetical protein [Desulfomonile sp.]
MRAIHTKVIIAGAIGAAALAVLGLAAVFVPAVAADNDSFDRSACLEECRTFYLGPELGAFPGEDDEEIHWKPGRGLSDGIVQRYYQCIMRCEKKFWDRFDKDADKALD